jgi:hypothetical protein
VFQLPINSSNYADSAAPQVAGGPPSGGVADGDAQVVGVAELRDEHLSMAALETIASSVRAAVLRQHGVLLHAILLLKPHGTVKVPKFLF